MDGENSPDPTRSAPAGRTSAANKAAGARILVGALLFAFSELRRADPDAAEAERARAMRALGGRDVEQRRNDNAG